MLQFGTGRLLLLTSSLSVAIYLNRIEVKWKLLSTSEVLGHRLLLGLFTVAFSLKIDLLAAKMAAK